MVHNSFTELSNSVRSIFSDAGWKPGRRVQVRAAVPKGHPAYAILAEFGGLAIGEEGRGKECATSAIAFEHQEADRSILLWAELLQSRLVGVADVSNGHAELYVDEFGRFFFASCIHDAFAFEGASFPEAMERLLLEKRSQPMLRPDQAEVVMWGEVFSSDDPRVYKYR
jgi:hypothetical protein